MLCGEGPLEEADKQQDVCHITETAEHPGVDVWMAPSIIRCISLAMVWGMPCPRLVILPATVPSPSTVCPAAHTHTP